MKTNTWSYSFLCWEFCPPIFPQCVHWQYSPGFSSGSVCGAQAPAPAHLFSWQDEGWLSFSKRRSVQGCPLGEQQAVNRKQEITYNHINTCYLASNSRQFFSQLGVIHIRIQTCFLLPAAFSAAKLTLFLRSNFPFPSYRNSWGMGMHLESLSYENKTWSRSDFPIG